MLAGLSVFLACAALLDWPAVAKPLTLALLVLALLSWILVLALTVVLRRAPGGGGGRACGCVVHCRWPSLTPACLACASPAPVGALVRAPICAPPPPA